MIVRLKRGARRGGIMRLAAAVAVLLGSLLLLAKPVHKALPFIYPYARPAVTVDNVIVSLPGAGQEHGRVLLIRRRNPPFKGYYALPGGFVEPDEGLDEAAARELHEETSLEAKDALVFTQVGTFGDLGRDPRGWLVDVVYGALVQPSAVRASDDVTEASWHDLLNVPTPLAVDHQLILRKAFRQLAKEEAAQSVKGLAEQLRKAADLLEGPWQHTEGEKPPSAEPQRQGET